MTRKMYTEYEIVNTLLIVYSYRLHVYTLTSHVVNVQCFGKKVDVNMKIKRNTGIGYILIQRKDRKQQLITL